jgi:hypothetical protein
MLPSLFTHSITSLAASGEIYRKLRAEEVHGVSKVVDGMANCYHFIATVFMISLAKLEHGREGRLDVGGTIESDFISAFVY